MILGNKLERIPENQVVTLGFGMCWKPGGKGEDSSPIYTLQLSNKTTTAMFRISQWNHSIPKELSDLLSSKKVRFVTLGKRDFLKLKEDYEIEIQQLKLDDFHIVQRCKPNNLQGLSAFFLRVFYQKDVKYINWNRKTLSELETQNICLDAWIIMALYEKILEIDSHYDKTTGILDLKK